MYVTSEDVQRIAAHLELDEPTFRARYTRRVGRRTALRYQNNLDCIFLEGNACRVHDVKPRQCERWPFWKPVVESRAAFTFSQSYCPALRAFTHDAFKQLAQDEEVL